MSLDSVLSHLPSASGQQPSLTHLLLLQQQSMETTLTLLGRDLILEAQRLLHTRLQSESLMELHSLLIAQIAMDQTPLF
jgi:hypothetical protein